jgi:hypothetical protein
MNMKKILSATMAIAAITTSTFSYANFQFKSLSGTCSDLDGKWQGRGHATNFLVDCYYHGEASITMTDASHFIFTVSVDKESGNFLCPAHNEQKLMASCDNGNISIATDYGTLNGIVENHQGYASGTLSIIGIKSDVEISFNR